jgi:hypothetical protein
MKYLFWFLVPLCFWMVKNRSLDARDVFDRYVVFGWLALGLFVTTIPFWIVF